MLTIFDPANRWLGTSSPFVLSQGNKAPVTVDDTVSVVQGSAPVSIPVLANDFDPEGATLTLVSANAALGTAVVEADGSVTYTLPVGITGFDTVIYEIADDLDQRQIGQVNIEITAPDLSISVLGDNTMSINAAAGQVDVTVTQPAAFAGAYQTTTSDVLSGPVALVAPKIAGTAAEGQVLSAVPGLWVYETGQAEPVSTWQWRVGGSDVSGATSASYTIQSGDLSLGITLREILADANGQRFADSAVTDDGGGAFQPSDDTALIGWWDAADAATVTHSGGAVSALADKAGGDPLSQGVTGVQPTTGSRTLNGLNVLDFDGTQFLAATRSIPGTGNVAFHMALEIDSTSNVFESLISADATNDFQLDALDGTVFTGRLNVAGIGASLNLTGGPFSGALILSLVFDQTGAGQAEVFVSNVSRGIMAYTAALDPALVLRLMCNRAGTISQDGAFAELIVTGDLTNRAAHHTYLANKWGLV